MNSKLISRTLTVYILYIYVLDVLDIKDQYSTTASSKQNSLVNIDLLDRENYLRYDHVYS